MIDDDVVWDRLAGLLPEAEAREVTECRDIGEQEAALDLLVSGLLAHQVPISETTRAELSVVAEVWAQREVLTPRILRCRGDDAPARLKLIEHPGQIATSAVTGPDPDEPTVLVPWIACTRCGHTLMRAHTREFWGGLSFLAWHYVISSPEAGAVLRVFPDDSADKAFAALVTECAEPGNEH